MPEGLQVQKKVRDYSYGKKEKKECEETGSWRTGCLCSDYGSWIYGGVLLFLQPFSERNYDQWHRLQQQDSHAGEKEDSETAWAV